jgi:hypothetical protein
VVDTALPRRASKEAQKRETIMPWFIDFHRMGVNTLVMSVSTEHFIKKPTGAGIFSK